MEIDPYQLLKDTPGLTVFLGIAAGYLLGNATVARIQLGPVAGVLVAGLVLGHLGFEPVPFLESLGFSLFIYSVGLQAGPRFFNVMLQEGGRYFALAVVVAATALLGAWLLAVLVGFEQGISGGILAGALTSTPTLMGAQDALRSGNVPIAEGLTMREAVTNVSIGYALTYVFGTAGLILMIKAMPGVLKIDLRAEARKVAERHGLGAARVALKGGAPLIRAYRVENPAVVEGDILHPGQDRDFLEAVVKIRRGDDMIPITEDTELRLGDRVAIIATPRQHGHYRDAVGPEVFDEDLLDDVVDSWDVVVTRDGAAGKTLKELHAASRYGCFVTAITRAQIEVPVNPDMVLHNGDVLRITGARAQLAVLTQRIGEAERGVQETDLFTFAIGICLGLVAGQVQVRFGDLSVGLGLAGGLLLVGILFGFLRAVHPTFGRVPPAARFVIMELGLMFFMVSVGLRAGAGIVDALISMGPLVIASGVIVTTLPLVLGYGFGRRVLGLNPALLLGALTGAMTSTPALSVVSKAADSPVPALGYAGTYTFANVLLTFAGTLIVIFG